MAEGKKPRSKGELEAGLNKLCAEYDRYCCETLTTNVADDPVKVAQWRSKIKALYWALGEEEL